MFKTFFDDKGEVNANLPDLSVLEANILCSDKVDYRQFLHTNHVYNIIHSGRGFAKTSVMINIILYKSFDYYYHGTNFLIYREYKNSIDSSLFDKFKKHIASIGFTQYFKFTIGKITNIMTQVTINFVGVQNPDSIQSFDFSLSWGEEAHKIKLQTFEIVLPTGRRADGEPVTHYLTYNPRTPLDPVEFYKNRADALVMSGSIYDLPKNWQNKALLAEAEYYKANEYEKWLHIWKGGYIDAGGGFAFINMNYTEPIMPNADAEVYIFLDPSYKGIDNTALTFAWILGDKVMVYGVQWAKGWHDCIEDVVNTCNIVLENARKDNYYFYYEANGGVGLNPQRALWECGIMASPQETCGEKHSKIMLLTSIYQYIYFINTPLNNSYNNDIKKFFYKTKEHDDAPDCLAMCLLKMGILNTKINKYIREY